MRKKLTEEQWQEVFRLRCRSKRGENLGKKDHNLCMRAFKEDPERYGKMDGEVFNATVPFGSTATWKGKS